MPDQTPIVMWFRQDLRLADNPALTKAIESGQPVVALYVLDEMTPDIRAMGGAQKWWLHHSLASLSADLENIGGRLVLRRGAAGDVVRDVMSACGSTDIVWNRRYGDPEQAIDADIMADVKESGGTARSCKGLLMHEPANVRTGSGNPYRVYTPFWKNLAGSMEVRHPLPAPEAIPAFTDLESDALDDWALLPTKPDWSGGIGVAWDVGEAAAHRQLDAFLSDDLRDYDEMRNFPAPDRTSRMSPYLRHGEVSPHQLWHACQDGRRTADPQARETWAKELVWREFSYHLLFNEGPMERKNFKPAFDDFEWENDDAKLKAWQRGRTGYPIVDAGMRQLWETGWMHNRVRMITGSFLVKHLLIDWKHGEDWFWDCLVDGDPASNPAQWQWVAGTGADAAPFFRIFNPILQATKFDPDGRYIKRFVPELADLPAQYLGAPWDAPADVLAKAGVELGKTYPRPIVDHASARKRALDRLAAATGKEAGKDE